VPFRIALKTSNPIVGLVSTPSLPVAASWPELAGDWITVWSSTESRSNSVVAVFGSASLFVYAAPVTPVPVVAGGPGYVSTPSVSVAPVSTFTRRFWPPSPITRRRSTVGLKSTPKEVPLSATFRRDFSVAWAVLSEITYTPPWSPRPYRSPVAGR
jgi:hypothetical protein